MKRKILEFFLLPLTKFVLRRYQPKIVAITGSVGKTSTKEAIAAVLARKFSVRKTKNNLNTEIGLCLTIIGGDNAKSSFSGWFKNLLTAIWLAVRPWGYFPGYLVLEMGADKPGDIGVLTGLAKPNLAVVTALGDIPVHVANYDDIDDLAREKQKILKAVSQPGWAIMNADDPRVSAMKPGPETTIFTFGFSDKALIRVVDYTVRLGDDQPDFGISFRLQYQGSSVPVRFTGVLGRPYAYACAAAAACGIACGMNLVEIASGLEQFRPEKGRMVVIPGINGSVILDDSYNAAPAATSAALETLADCKGTGRRLIGVLGDMLELGEYTEQAHGLIGKQAASVCDILFLVGNNMDYAFKQIGQSGFDKKNLFHVNDSGSVSELILPLLSAKDVVLVKGSQGMRMEKVTKQIMADPGLAADLLVRQTREWQPN